YTEGHLIPLPMKYLLGLLVLALLAAGVYAAVLRAPMAAAPEDERAAPPADASVPADGTYTVVAEDSQVTWAGQKPLLEGYVNTGSIAVSDGEITVAGEQATGSF